MRWEWDKVTPRQQAKGFNSSAHNGDAVCFGAAAARRRRVDLGRLSVGMRRA
jgi:hypothetical protein